MHRLFTGTVCVQPLQGCISHVLLQKHSRAPAVSILNALRPALTIEAFLYLLPILPTTPLISRLVFLNCAHSISLPLWRSLSRCGNIGYLHHTSASPEYDLSDRSGSIWQFPPDFSLFLSCGVPHAVLPLTQTRTSDDKETKRGRNYKIFSVSLECGRCTHKGRL